MNWDQFSARRRVTLADFISNCSTADEAIDLFSRKQIGNPPVAEIQQVIASRSVSQDTASTDVGQTDVDPSLDDSQANASVKKTKNASGTPGN